MVNDVLIVFEPINKQYNFKRFLISINTLPKYITQKNANKVLLKAQKMKTNKTTIKFRKYGKIEIYLK